MPTKEPSGVCDTGDPESYKDPGGGAEFKEIDLDQVDHVLYGDYNSMYEIKNPTIDIQCRVKIR